MSGLLSLLLVVLAHLSAAAGGRESSVSRSEGPPSFFLKDQEELCLAGSSFTRCGVDTLWYVTGRAGGYQMHKRPRDEEDTDRCLIKAKCHLDESGAKVGSCNHCGAQNWNIVGDTETGHVLTQDNNKNCVERVPNSTTVRLIPCDSGYVFLSLQFATLNRLEWFATPQSRLIAAAYDNDIRSTKEILKSGQVDVNAFDSEDNMFPLLAAVNQEHEDMVKLLLEQSEINVNQAVIAETVNGVPGTGVTALIEATMKSQQEIVKMLLAAGADPDMYTSEVYGGLSALWVAASEGDETITKLLLDGGADSNAGRLSVNITPLMAAAAGGHAEVVDMLLAAGADVNAKDNDGVTALLNVAEHGDLSTLQLLLKFGANVNDMSHNNFSPLIVAAAHGHYDIISALIDAGANVNMPHPDGVSPLMYAAANGKRSDAVGLLLANGADVNQKHAHGGTALIESCTSGNMKIVEVLLAFGANMSIADSDGVTPLMSAAAAGNVDVVQLLLKSKVNVDEVAFSGGTAIMYAAGQGHVKTCRLLLEEGGADPWIIVQATEAYKEQVKAAIAAGDKDAEPHVDGVNALLIAIDGGYEDIVRLLLNQSADTNDPSLLSQEAKDGLKIQDENGHSALITALRGNHTSIALLLLDLGANPNESFIDDDGREHSILMAAIRHSNTSWALSLIDKGADCTFVDLSTSTSLVYQATVGGQAAVLQALINCLSNNEEPTDELMTLLKLGNNEGITPLYAAVAEGHHDVASQLLAVIDKYSVEEVNALVNHIDNDGTSVLMAASAAGNASVVEKLIDRGANLNIQNSEGHTPLMFAYNGKSQAEMILKNYNDYVRRNFKDDVDEVDNSKDDIILLIEEAVLSHEALIALLINRGADPNAKDKLGRLAVDYGMKGNEW